MPLVRCDIVGEKQLRGVITSAGLLQNGAAEAADMTPAQRLGEESKVLDHLLISAPLLHWYLQKSDQECRESFNCEGLTVLLRMYQSLAAI